MVKSPVTERGEKEMDLSRVGVVPKRTADPLEALSLVRSEGGAILTGLGLDGEDGRNASFAVFGDDVLAVPSAARVFIGGEQDRASRMDTRTRLVRTPTRTDTPMVKSIPTISSFSVPGTVRPGVNLFSWTATHCSI